MMSSNEVVQKSRPGVDSTELSLFQSVLCMSHVHKRAHVRARSAVANTFIGGGARALH